MAESKKLIPKRRFKEFQNAGEWEHRKIQSFVDDGILAPPMDGNHGEKHPTTRDYVASGIPFIMARDLDSGQVDLKHCSFISAERAERLDKGFAQNNDILLTHKATIGETAIIKGLKEKYAILTPQVTYYRILDLKKLSIDYLYAFFNTERFQNELRTEAIQSTRAYIGITDQRKLSVKFPVNIDEQKKIGSYFSNLDNLITLHLQKLDKIKSIKKAYLSEMFPAEGESKPKRRFKGFTDDWELRKLGELATLTSSKRIHAEDYVDSGIPFYRGKEISELKDDKVVSELLYITTEKYEAVDRMYGSPNIGDLLITAVGTIGNTWVVDKTPFYFKDGNLIWFKNIKCDPIYLDYVLNSPDGRVKVMNSAIGSNQKALTIVKLNEIAIHLPRLEEQRVIGNYFSNLDNLIALHQKKLDKLKNLKKSYLNEMFV